MTKDERIAELKESLDTFGRHDRQCQSIPCNCGWAKVIACELTRESEELGLYGN